VQALDRLISILEIVALQSEPIGAAEVAREMDLPLSTVARLMRQLTDAGLLYRAEPDSRYALGYRVFALASTGVAQVDLAEVAKPVMRELRNASGETTSLHVMRGTQRVCIAEVQSQAQIRRVVAPGSTNALAGTATGDVLLVDASAAELTAATAAAGLSQAAERRLHRRLTEIAGRGYAINDDTAEKLLGISAPVREGGRIIAALTISGPSSRFSHTAAERQAPALLRAARSLSRPRPSDSSN
jgi:IclR family acetate operon transcriptional repressor